MGQPAVVVLALALAVGAAAAYCLARCVVPRWRGGHGVGVDAWHVAMGAAMVAMLVAPTDRGSAAVQTAVFGLAALWCAGHLLVRSWSGAHARLGAGCAVMAGMLAPVVVASSASASASASASVSAHHHVPVMDMSGTTVPGPAHATMPLPPGWLALLMLVVVVLIAGAAIRSAMATARGDTAHRLSLACEVTMAGAMGYMAAVAL